MFVSITQTLMDDKPTRMLENQGFRTAHLGQQNQQPTRRRNPARDVRIGSRTAIGQGGRYYSRIGPMKVNRRVTTSNCKATIFPIGIFRPSTCGRPGHSPKIRSAWFSIRRASTRASSPVPHSGLCRKTFALAVICPGKLQTSDYRRSSLSLVQSASSAPGHENSALVSTITTIDGWYLTSRQEDKWRMRERRITCE